MRQSPWLWIPSLFAAGEMPVAVILYVSLLMFLQARVPLALSSLYCGLLFVPWLLRGFLRERAWLSGGGRACLQLLELAMVLVMIAVALCFLWRGFSGFWLFLALLLFSVLAALHDLSSSAFYDAMLPLSARRAWSGVRLFFSQSAVVFTYGMMLMFVGALEVVYRAIRLSWCQACYALAGVLLLFVVYHLFALPRGGAVQTVAFPRVGLRARLAGRGHWRLALVALFVLLLPQSLLFLSRVVFLLTPSSRGGLGCTLQDVAFAQGAVGVIGYSLGVVLCRGLLRSGLLARPFWPLCVALGLSPSVYVVMVAAPPSSLPLLCVATFLAQFLFGFGVPVCGRFVACVGGEPSVATANYVLLPLVALVMLAPVSLSGWLLSVLGFPRFFVLAALLAPFSWVVVALLGVRRKLLVDVCDA